MLANKLTGLRSIYFVFILSWLIMQPSRRWMSRCVLHIGQPTSRLSRGPETHQPAIKSVSEINMAINRKCYHGDRNNDFESWIGPKGLKIMAVTGFPSDPSSSSFQGGNTWRLTTSLQFLLSVQCIGEAGKVTIQTRVVWQKAILVKPWRDIQGWIPHRLQVTPH